MKDFAASAQHAHGAPPEAKPTPTAKESEFRREELFFSTTDSKGIILDGNQVFVRVSRYSRNELIGRPHNIIRHPDMPRSVFRLLWDTIQAGKTIAAYVKNMAKDGSYYWVTAVVSPVPCGYLSMRFKPASPYFEVAKKLYVDLLNTEKEIERSGGSRKASMDASSSLLLDALRTNGFPDYQAFMWSAISAELDERSRFLRDGGGRNTGAGNASPGVDRVKTSLARILAGCTDVNGALDRLSASAEGLKHLNSRLAEQSRFIEELAQAVRLTSFNAMVESSRLNDAGATLGVIAGRMAEHSDTIAATMPVLQSQITKLLPLLQKTVFDVSICRLSLEMASNFCRELLELDLGAQDTVRAWENIRTLINEAFSPTCNGVISSFSDLSSKLGHLGLQLVILEDAIRSLEFVQLGGRVEASRLDNPESFDIIFSQVAKRAADARSRAAEFRGELDNLVQSLSINSEHEARIAQCLARINAELKRAAEVGRP